MNIFLVLVNCVIFVFSVKDGNLCNTTESWLQIIGGIEDNSKIIFLISQRKCDLSLESSQRDGSNDGSQNMFLWRNIASYP